MLYAPAVPPGSPGLASCAGTVPLGGGGAAAREADTESVSTLDSPFTGSSLYAGVNVS